MEEEMFLGLRKIEGVSINHFEEKFGKKLDTVYGSTIERLISEDMLKVTGDLLSLTDKGLILGNEVFKEFLLK
jgi:oxygen-independent coproporphyrinogen-3 oxidase